MANNSKEFIIKLFLDSDVKGGKEAKEAIERVSKAAQDLTNFGKGLSLSLTAPLAAFAGFASKTFIDFEAQMSRVKAISGASTEQLKAMTAQARELGATTRFSASQAAEAMANLSLAGFSVEETMGAMPSLLGLAAAATLDMGTAASITSNIMRGFNLQVSDLGHVNDVLVKAFTSSNTDLRGLGDAMRYVAPVAKAAGQSIEDVTAAVGALSNAGLQGSMAGTSLRASIAALVNPTTAGAKILRELGVSTKDASGKMRPFIDIVRDLGAAEVQTEQIFEIFGQRAASAVAALVQQGGDNLKKFSDDLRDSAGTTAQIAKEQEDNIRGALYQIKSAWEEVQLSFTDGAFAKALREVIMQGYDMLTAFSKADDSTKKMIVSIGLAVAAVGPLTLATGKLVSVIATLSKWSTPMVMALRAMGTGMAGLQIKTALATGALVAFRAALSALGIGLVIAGLSYLAGGLMDNAIAAGEARKKVDDAGKSLAVLATNSSDARKELDGLFKSTASPEIVAKLKAEVDAAAVELERLRKLRETADKRDDRKKRGVGKGAKYGEGGLAEFQNRKELNEAIRKLDNRRIRIKNEYQLKEIELSKISSEEQKKLAEENSKKLEQEDKRLAQSRRTHAIARMSDADKLIAKEDELAEAVKQVAHLESVRADKNVSADEKVIATQQLIEKEKEVFEIEKSLIDLRKKADEENKRAAELEKKKSNAVAAKKNLDILRATVAQNWQLVDALSDELAIEREFLSLKEQGGIADEEARAIAEEKVALNRQIINEERLAKMQDKVIEAEINSLRKDGKKIEADALEIRKKTKDYANDFKVSYEDALEAIKKIDEIQNGGDKKNNKNGKLGTNYDQLEKRQKQIQKNLDSKNIGTVEKGRRQQEEFENKYGIGITDDVRDYRGRDRSTGRLINAKVGKEARENEHYSAEAYAQAAKDGDIVRPKSEAAALQPVSPINASTAIAAKAPLMLNGKPTPPPPAAFGQNPKVPAAFGQNSKAPAGVAQSQPLGLFANREGRLPLLSKPTESESIGSAAAPENAIAEEKAKEERRQPKSISAGKMPAANNMVSSAAGKKSDNKKTAEKSKGDSGGAGEITSTVEQGVAALATIVADIKKLVDGIENLKRELNGSVSRLNRR